MRPITFALGLLALIASMAHAQQLDPLTLPTPRPASKGQYQYGVEMLKLDRAWTLTHGRAPLAIVDGGLMLPHEELGSGLEGNVRYHLSETVMDTNPRNSYHSMMVTGAIVARGFNGKGVTGSCPACSASLHEV